MDVTLCVYYFEQAHDVVVRHASQDIDLTMDGHKLGLTGKKLLFVAFKSQDVTCVLVCALFNGGKGSMTDVFVRYEVQNRVEHWFFPLSFKIFDHSDELLLGCLLSGEL